MALYPSGTQYTLTSGGTTAVVTQCGAGLRELTVAGRALVDGYPAGERCSAGRGQQLVPWPNRLADAVYSFGGSRHQLPVTEPATNAASHGLVRWQQWRAEEAQPDSVTLRLTLFPQPGWDWPLQLSVSYQVAAEGVTVTTTAENQGTSPAPFAAGAHPYLKAGDGLLDDWTLTAPAATALTVDDRKLPTGRRPVDGTDLDFRSGRRIGDAVLDTPLTDLEPGEGGLARVTVRGDWTTELWLDRSYRFLQVFSGDTVPQPERRRRGLAVEPMTAPADAFNSGDALVTLEPGDSWTGTWGIRLVG